MVPLSGTAISPVARAFPVVGTSDECPSPTMRSPAKDSTPTPSACQQVKVVYLSIQLLRQVSRLPTRTVTAKHDGGVEKEQYVRSARRIQDEADREIDRMMHSAMTRPWRFGNITVALAAVMRTALVELTALDGPPPDRAALELHFLRPLRAQVDRLAEDAARIRRDFYLLRFRSVAREISRLDSVSMGASDEAWCIAYGLIDPRGQAEAPRFTDMA
jgi:hypothetical protein